MELKNKKIMCIGDSITEYRPNHGDFLAEITGVPAIFHGKSGTGFATCYNGSESFLERLPEINDDADIIIVCGGTNDFSFCKLPLGDICDKSTSTFSGCVNAFYEGLISKYPEATIVQIIEMHRDNEKVNNYETGHTFNKINDIIRNSCEHYSIPVLDLWSFGGMCPRELVHHTFAYDGIHPTELGYKRIASMLRGLLESL